MSHQESFMTREQVMELSFSGTGRKMVEDAVCAGNLNDFLLFETGIQSIRKHIIRKPLNSEAFQALWAMAETCQQDASKFGRGLVQYDSLPESVQRLLPSREDLRSELLAKLQAKQEYGIRTLYLRFDASDSWLVPSAWQAHAIFGLFAATQQTISDDNSVGLKDLIVSKKILCEVESLRCILPTKDQKKIRRMQQFAPLVERFRENLRRQEGLEIVAVDASGDCFFLAIMEGCQSCGIKCPESVNTCSEALPATAKEYKLAIEKAKLEGMLEEATGRQQKVRMEEEDRRHKMRMETDAARAEAERRQKADDQEAELQKQKAAWDREDRLKREAYEQGKQQGKLEAELAAEREKSARLGQEIEHLKNLLSSGIQSTVS